MSTVKKKLVVFPNDPILSYYRKGEITEGYFNPSNFFDEIHIISFAKEEVKSELVRCIAGNALLEIHRFGRITPLNFIGLALDYFKVLSVVKKINPLVIRGFNSNVTGFIAVSTSKLLRKPSIVSLHINPDKDIRYHLIAEKKILKYLVWFLIGKIIEPYVLKNADRVICAYKFIKDYAMSKRETENGVVVIYNKVNNEQFSSKKLIKNNKKIIILVVGRLFNRKNPENIIKAVEDLDVELNIIGDGPYYENLLALSEKLNIEHKVNMIRSVPNSEIHSYYLNADLFASVNEYGGVSKPVIEAMNASLPIVVQKPLWEERPELIGECSLIAENSPEGFKGAFLKLISNEELRLRLGNNAEKIAMTISKKEMESKEVKEYQQLINNSYKGSRRNVCC